MIQRPDLQTILRQAVRRSRVVSLIGPRQCGKTTLARQFVEADSPNYFDLEDPASLKRLDEPMTALDPLKGIVVIDEIQRRPELFPILRVLTDRKPLSTRFLILGSASPQLLRQSSESLAGRLETVEMSGFSLSEVGKRFQPRHWRRGGFPLSFLAGSENDSFSWRKNFIQTFLERDLPQLGVQISAVTLLRFWTMLAHYHGQIWNGLEIARSLGIGETSVRRYLDLLQGVFMVRQLLPWHENLKKRQIKSPKIYFRDTGLLHQLLGIKNEQDLFKHPKCGASWEGYIIEEIFKISQPDEAYFWGTHNEAELDLFLIKKGIRVGVECKFVDAPSLTASMRIVLRDLKLKHLYVIYPGHKTYKLTDQVWVIPFELSMKKGFDLFAKPINLF